MHSVILKLHAGLAEQDVVVTRSRGAISRRLNTRDPHAPRVQTNLWYLREADQWAQSNPDSPSKARQAGRYERVGDDAGVVVVRLAASIS